MLLKYLLSEELQGIWTHQQVLAALEAVLLQAQTAGLLSFISSSCFSRFYEFHDLLGRKQLRDKILATLKTNDSISKNIIGDALSE